MKRIAKVYRPFINDPEREIRKRMDSLEEKTGMKRQHLEKKAFEEGIARLEEINK